MTVVISAEDHLKVLFIQQSHKHIISALGAIKDNEYIIPSSINITTKHLINHHDAGIKGSEGIVTVETYKGKGYFDENIKQKFYKLN